MQDSEFLDSVGINFVSWEIALSVSKTNGKIINEKIAGKEEQFTDLMNKML